MHSYKGAKKGPKEKYRPEFCDLILEVASVPGQYKAAMLLAIGQELYRKPKPISTSTFHEWCKEHPEFNEAWEISQIIIQANMERTLMQLATGECKGNFKALELLARTKFKDEYKQNQEEVKTTINNNLTIENLSIEDLKYRIARSQESLTKSGIVIDHEPPLLESPIEPE